jgi:hypothetical protein
MGLIMFNGVIDSQDCKMAMPAELFEGIKLSMCLVKDPEATADYLDFSFCGETTRDAMEGNRAILYSPEPLAMSDDVTSRMFYVWQSEALINRFIEVLFEAGKLEYTVTKDNHPEMNQGIIAKLNEIAPMVGKEPLPQGAEVSTTFKALEPPKVIMKKNDENAIEGKAKVQIAHKFSNCETCPDEVKATITYGAKGKATFEEAGQDQMFPKATLKHTITEFVVETDEATEEQLATLTPKLKENFQKTLDELHKQWTDKAYKYHDEMIPVYLRLFQVKNVAFNVLDKTEEIMADVKFDIEKMSNMTAMYDD